MSNTLPALETFNSREEWLNARRVTGIGSSDAPAVLGVSSFKSPYQLYQEKVGAISASKEENELLEWGRILEEPIAQRFAAETKRIVRNPNLDEDGRPTFRLVRSEEMPFMLAQVDRYQLATVGYGDEPPIQAGESILEIKNTHFFAGRQWLIDQEPPLEYLVQVQHQMAVTGKRWASIAALVGGTRFIYADIKRDDEFIRMLIQREVEFWDGLVRGVPPPVDGSARTAEMLGRIYRTQTSGDVIAAPPEYLDIFNEAAQAKQEEKTAAERRRAAENKFKALIGENAGCRLPNGTLVLWKPQTRKSYVVKESTFRVLRAFEARRPQLPAGSVAPLELPEPDQTLESE